MARPRIAKAVGRDLAFEGLSGTGDKRGSGEGGGVREEITRWSVVGAVKGKRMSGEEFWCI